MTRTYLEAPGDTAILRRRYHYLVAEFLLEERLKAVVKPRVPSSAAVHNLNTVGDPVGTQKENISIGGQMWGGSSVWNAFCSIH